jgi:hypothetical protein
MTDNKDESKDKKSEPDASDKENRDEIHASKSPTVEELDKVVKNENISELFKAFSKSGGTLYIGNLIIGDIQGDAVGHDQTKTQVPPTETAEKNVIWRDDSQPIENRTLLLSVAVFNGASLQTVTDAQKRLQEMIFEIDLERKSKTSLFELPLHKRLTDIGASIKDGDEDTQYGRVRTKIVELNDSSLPPIIIKHYWDEYKFDAFHELLVRWFRDAADNTPFQMRVRVAVAVGELMKSDFRPIETDILSKWATSPNPTTRISAAIAITIPAFDDEWTHQVLKLLHYWSTVNNWRLCWTATATYAGPIGLKFPDEALKDLRYIAKTGDLRLIGVLTQSIRSLFDEGETNENLYKKILDSLIDWTEKPKEAQGTVGLFVFLNLARTARIKADPEGDDWYTLLWLLQKRDKYPSNQIVSLWRRALNLKQSRMEAIKILQKWVKSIDDDARLYEPLEWLVKEISKNDESRERDRLRYYLHKMTESPSAEKLLRAI